MARAFQVGDLVRWTSSSSRAVLRVGVIVAVVPPAVAPALMLPAGRWSLRFDAHAVRQSESYLVALKQPGGATGILHRPWVSRMRHFSDGPDAVARPPARAVARRTRSGVVVAAPEAVLGPLARAWRALRSRLRWPVSLTS